MARIHVRRPAIGEKLVEIRDAPVRNHHHTRQRAGILVHIGVRGTGDERKIAGGKRWIDLFDWCADGDETQTEQIGEG